MGSLALRPGDSLPNLKMGLSIGSRDSVPFLPAIQVTKHLTLASMGVIPLNMSAFRQRRWVFSAGFDFPGRTLLLRP